MTDKQKLALRRGSVLRSIKGMKGLCFYMFYSRYNGSALSHEERLIIATISKNCDLFIKDFTETGIKKGLKPRKISDKHITQL